jgi:rhodanese-related sulfurtransferase
MSDTGRRRNGCFGRKETNEERCHRLNHFYQAKYHDVPTLTSRQLIENYDHDNIVLVDVRTKPERNVSKIEGSISLQEFQEQFSSLPPDKHVVTYCTIGYRSGLEARRLQYQHNLQGRISSLDGIVAYTHAISKQDANEDVPQVVCPSTGCNTTVVHTFGKQWSCVDEGYETKHFSPPALILRLVQVGTVVIVRTIQYGGYRLGQCARSNETATKDD